MKKHKIITNELNKIIDDIYKHDCEASDKIENNDELSEISKAYLEGLHDAYCLTWLKLQTLCNLIERGDIFENH